MTFDLKKRRIADNDATVKSRRAIPCPLVPGDKFVVTVSYMSPSAMERLNRASMKSRFDEQSRMTRSTVDRATAARLFVEHHVHGWEGLTVGALQQFMPLDVTAEELDLPVEFTKQNAIEFILGSTTFDAWMLQQTTDATLFALTPPRPATEERDPEGK